MRLSDDRQRLHEHVNAASLSGTARPENHDAVAHPLRLVQLDQLDRPRRMVDELDFVNLFCDGSFEVRISDLLESEVWEEIVDEREEERFVLVDKLGQVHVPQDPHHDGRLGVLRVVPLRGAQGSKHRQDVSETEVVMNLFTRRCFFLIFTFQQKAERQKIYKLLVYSL